MYTEKLKVVHSNKFYVVGDLHGDFVSLQKILESVDVKNFPIIFLGDYADRGKYGLEVYQTILLLKEKYGENVIMLKGNHEDYERVDGEIVPKFSPCTFIQELKLKVGESWRKRLEEFFHLWNSLPLAVLVPRRFLLVHGGVTSKIKELNDLAKPSKEVEEAILWSDPMEEFGELANPRGAGVLFGPDVSEKVCKALNVKKIIRSHQPHLPEVLEKGYGWYHGGRVLTLSSTTVCGGVAVYAEVEGEEIRIKRVE